MQLFPAILAEIIRQNYDVKAPNCSGITMRRTSRTTRTSPTSNYTGLWVKGLSLCSLALFGHLVVRSLIAGVRDGGIPLVARPTPGSLTVSIQASPVYTEQLLQNIYYQALIAGYYFTAGVMGLGLVVLVVGGLIVSRRK